MKHRKKQSVRLGGSGNSPIVLSNIEGRMWVTNNQWNHLYINGDMPESMGFAADGKRMRFDVRGALSVSNQSVKLKKMSTPFGNLNMTYDMENHRLMGNLSFTNSAGSMEIRGDAEIVVDKYGYYFMAGGGMEMSNPSIKARHTCSLGITTTNPAIAVVLLRICSKSIVTTTRH